MSLSKNFVNQKKRKLNTTPVSFTMRDLLYNKMDFQKLFLEAPENVSTYLQFIAELIIFVPIPHEIQSKMEDLALVKTTYRLKTTDNP